MVFTVAYRNRTIPLRYCSLVVSCQQCFRLSALGSCVQFRYLSGGFKQKPNRYRTCSWAYSFFPRHLRRVPSPRSLYSFLSLVSWYCSTGILNSVVDPDTGFGASLTPGSGMGKNKDPGWTFWIISESLETIFLIKILKFFHADADPVIFWPWIRDRGWKKFGSGRRTLILSHPVHTVI